VDEMKFVHVATRTSDLDRALVFYEVLGLKLRDKTELQRGRATLAFIESSEANFALELIYNWGKDDPYNGGERFGHFAFEVEGIDGLLQRLVAGGGAVQREPYLLEGTGPKLAFVSDPDGNPIELIER
jgi:lactoylglutathione lyase